MKFYKELNDEQVEVTKTDLTKEQYKFLIQVTYYNEVRDYVPGIDGSTIPLLIEELRERMERGYRTPPEGFVVSDEDLTDLITEYGDLSYAMDVEGEYTMTFSHEIPLEKEEVEELDLKELKNRTTLGEFDLNEYEVEGDLFENYCSGQVVTKLRLNLPEVDWS